MPQMQFQPRAMAAAELSECMAIVFMGPPGPGAEAIYTALRLAAIEPRERFEHLVSPEQALRWLTTMLLGMPPHADTNSDPPATTPTPTSRRTNPHSKLPTPR